MKTMITLDDFKKLEIKIGRVVSAERVPDSEKLIKLVFDVGNSERQIIAGVAEFFPDPSALVGKEMPLLLNIEPRTFRGHESQGMLIAADVDGRPVFLHPAEALPPGSVVR